MEIKAKIEKIFPTQKIKDTFRKREFVVEYSDNPQYPEVIKFECIQDKCDQLDQFAEGQMVNVSFNLKGRKWTDPKGEVKYFNSLQAWRITPESQAEPSPITGGEAPPPASTDEPDWLSSDDSDDLPF